MEAQTYFAHWIIYLRFSECDTLRLPTIYEGKETIPDFVKVKLNKRSQYISLKTKDPSEPTTIYYTGLTSSVGVLNSMFILYNPN